MPPTCAILRFTFAPTIRMIHNPSRCNRRHTNARKKSRRRRLNGIRRPRRRYQLIRRSLTGSDKRKG